MNRWMNRCKNGTARHGTARHGTARYRTARHGTARDGMVRHGTVWPVYLKDWIVCTKPLLSQFGTMRASSGFFFASPSLTASSAICSRFRKKCIPLVPPTPPFRNDSPRAKVALFFSIAAFTDLSSMMMCDRAFWPLASEQYWCPTRSTAA